MMRYPRRLIEIDLPIRRISEQAVREKSINHRHISSLHVWWARRPLAACRAVMCAALWPDPADEAVPARFLMAARVLMAEWAKQELGRCSEESFPLFRRISLKQELVDDPSVVRDALLAFLADFSNWDNSNCRAFLATARALTAVSAGCLSGCDGADDGKAATASDLIEGGKSGERPLVVDPFAGGGAIPLEALRCGADAFASDLNPISILLNRCMLEAGPSMAYEMAAGLEKWGKWVEAEAKKRLSEYYPKTDAGRVAIAYIWARTCMCEGPGCGAEIPLLGSFWLSKKQRCAVALDKGSDGSVHLSVVENIAGKDVGGGITAGNSMTCPLCGFTTAVARVKSQLCDRHGGSRDPMLVAVVSVGPNGRGRMFSEPTDADVKAVAAARSKVAKLEAGTINGVSAIPDETCPPTGALGYRFQPYGIKEWRDLYTDRQLVALCTFAEIVTGDDLTAALEQEMGADGAAFMQALLGLCVSRLNDRLCTLCRWRPDKMAVEAANGGQNKMPMLMDFAEANPLAGSSGDWMANVAWIRRVMEHLAEAQIPEATVMLGPAQEQLLPDESADLMFTDPPYYNAFGYCDLADFFATWLKRTQPDRFLDKSNVSGDKTQEAISIGKALDDGRGLIDDSHYASAMTAAFASQRASTKASGLGVVVFANKTTRGWEAILESLVDAGWIATASWPIATEMPTRQRAIGSAALNSSVHIVCRPREDAHGNLVEDAVGDWRDVLSALPGRIESWLPRLASEGVVGADAIFACLGPALEIFSRYSSVEKTSGEKVELREFLEHVWAEVAKQALNMIFEGADTAGLEEDARLTAMWLWTLRTDAETDVEAGEKVERIAGYGLEYDAARKIAQGLGCHLENLAHLVEIKGENATLLSAASRARYLFGKEDVDVPKKRRKKNAAQGDLFAELDLPTDEELDRKRAELERPAAGNTVLDQLHQSMILFGAGRGAALKRFLVDDGVGANPQLWSLAQSLSALYPPQSEEKRWVDGVLARKKGLGF